MVIATGKLHSFDVYVNGKLIFSKAESGRLPEKSEIIEEIERILALPEG